MRLEGSTPSSRSLAPAIPLPHSLATACPAVGTSMKESFAMSRFRTWWQDECGLVLSAELVIILTVVVIGLITGLACLQQAIVAELQDVSAAFRGLNQSYGFTGFRGCQKIWGRTSWTAGSAFYDRYDGCLNGNCTIGLGAEIIGGPTVAVPLTPRVESGIVVPGTPQAPLPVITNPGCQECQPLRGPAVPVPAPEIPQGPVPQSLPQL